jgi:tRNA uridine 5-carboxymethylaminomethyl modification enzyme
VAGINAAFSVQGKGPFHLRRDEAYAGVLIDDLITKGTNEPYRMFTSRVEYRLLVREDNTDQRLAHHAHALGLMTDDQYEAVRRKQDHILRGIEDLRTTSVSLDKINPILEACGSAPSHQMGPLLAILKRPQVTFASIAHLVPALDGLSKEVSAQLEYEVKYAGFIERQKKEVEKFRHLENIRVPEGFDYGSVSGLSHEVRQKLEHFRPVTLGQANRISGITPAAVSILMISLRKYFADRQATE